MAPLSDCYSFAFNRLKANFAFYLVAGLVIVFVPGVLSWVAQLLVGVIIGVIGAAGKWNTDSVQMISGLASIPFSFLIGLLPLLFYPPFYKGVEAEFSGSNASPGSLFEVGPYILPSIIAGILSGLIVAAGFILCIIPGLLLLPLFYVSMYFVARGETGTGAISKALSVLTSQPVTIAYWWGIFLPLGLLGMLLCCVGGIATFPMSLAAFCFMMRSLEGAGAVSPEPPPLPAA